MKKTIFSILAFTHLCNAFASQEICLPEHATVHQETNHLGTTFFVAHMPGHTPESLYAATMQNGTIYAGGYNRVAPSLINIRGALHLTGKERFTIVDPANVMALCYKLSCAFQAQNY